MASSEFASKIGTAFMAYATTAYGMSVAPRHPYMIGALAGVGAYSIVDATSGSKYAPWAAIGAALPFALSLGLFQRIGLSGLGAPQYRLPQMPVTAVGFPRSRRRL
jgi:hypothetical protein